MGNLAAILNLLGFITGAALYGMLTAMVLPSIRSRREDKLLLGTGIVGVIWNIGAMVIYGFRDFGLSAMSPWFDAAIYSSLGLLPAVTVHSVLLDGRGLDRRVSARLIAASAYSISVFASLLMFYSAARGGEMPPVLSMRILTYGYIALIGALLVHVGRSSLWKRTIWVTALAVFGVSALHISQHSNSASESLLMSLIGHHASLPLVVAILYQDYRFALADIFMKRALVLIALLSIIFSAYLFVLLPILKTISGELPFLAALFALWTATAFIYPYLRRVIVWFVDTIVLRRGDYSLLRDEISIIANSSEDTDDILNKISNRLAQAFTAGFVRIIEHDAPECELIEDSAASLYIPTHESPFYTVALGKLGGGDGCFLMICRFWNQYRS